MPTHLHHPTTATTATNPEHVKLCFSLPMGPDTHGPHCCTYSSSHMQKQKQITKRA
ncbi:hypothetical protein COCCADRAFT_87800 [Bipolaris zeicola 26-R-13]|uniref:Uncharacterized protein n=1 Tax=Cochliobolus carbonum (strain 26-R-13) TaxID=930089 RepID=W6YG02_COCC2|nr:uncharacterized protein COCCADRAFT_87800 [Bipolaris zeicola 26-R-13]EUC36578.1 hypothetical protein COCCADRAFT_87800 [Bipolaris zeicola 26-R-13]